MFDSSGGMGSMMGAAMGSAMGNAMGSSGMSMPMDKDTFGAQVVTQTLNNMNQNQNGMGGGTNADYQFQKDVLSTAFQPKGNVFSGKF